jgi:hypothetical protein
MPTTAEPIHARTVRKRESRLILLFLPETLSKAMMTSFQK